MEHVLELPTQSPQLQEVPLEVAQKLPHQLEQLQQNSQQLIELGTVKDPTLVRQLLPVTDVSSQDSPASLTAEALARTGRPALMIICIAHLALSLPRRRCSHNCAAVQRLCACMHHA